MAKKGKHRNGTSYVLRLPALKVHQGKGRVLYSFAIDGKVLPSVATVSRVRRSDGAGDLEGYQRPEVLSHIAEIREYLESESPMIPNAIVVTFDKRVKFVPRGAGNGKRPGYVAQGTLVIPVDPTWDESDKPGFIVDGQQRLAAVRDADVKTFPLCAVAFISSDVTEQTEQFILVNSTKPLPKGLIYELLPHTDAKLPTQLHRRRFPAYLLERLNRDDDSPMKGKIQTPTTPDGAIKDNSVLKMLENSLNEGVLYRYRSISGDEHDEDKMLRVLKNFWSAVASTFPEAWDLPPRKSRLVHGAGIVALGFVMDDVAERVGRMKIPSEQVFKTELQRLAPHCRWTDGEWVLGRTSRRKWNEIQNTPKDLQLLANHLRVLCTSIRSASRRNVQSTFVYS